MIAGSSGYLKRERAAEEGKAEKPKVRELIKQKRAKFQTADPVESEALLWVDHLEWPLVLW